MLKEQNAQCNDGCFVVLDGSEEVHWINPEYWKFMQGFGEKSLCWGHSECQSLRQG